MQIQADGYSIKYEGGRLADVYIGSKPVECVQVRAYDFAKGEFGPEPTENEIREQVADFLNESGGIELYRENAL